MQISEYHEYLVLAGKGNDLKRHVVNGNGLKELFLTEGRVASIELIEVFECYTKHPETGEGGWDIQYIRGVRKAIERYHPLFDCIITKDYPSTYEVDVEDFLFTASSKDAYPLA